MRKNIEHILVILLILISLLACSSPSNALSTSMEEKFKTAIPLTDMNKSLVINVDDDDRVFCLGSDITVLVENKSSHFLFFESANMNYIKLFMIRGTEWVEVKNENTYSGSRVLSPTGSPLLNLDVTTAQPVLEDTLFKDDENILIRIVVLTGEIMKMDAYSKDWRDHENEILTGVLVGAYVDVYISRSDSR